MSRAVLISLLLLTGCALKKPTLQIPQVSHSEWGYVIKCPDGEKFWQPTKVSDEEMMEVCR